MNVGPEDVHKLAIEKGWYNFDRPIPELLCLIHAEISEALEGYRNNIQKGEKGWLGEELADAVIRIMDFSQGKDLDVDGAVLEKLNYNKTRPYLHGENKKY